MKSLFFKSIGASMAMAALLVVSACGGGGSSSSGVGAGSGGSDGVSPDATMVVKGRISTTGDGLAFELEAGTGVNHFTQLLADTLVPPAMAAIGPVGGAQVCFKGTAICDTTDATTGSFTLDASGQPPGQHTLVITLSDGTTYEAVIDLKMYSLMTIEGKIEEDDEEGDIIVTVTGVTPLNPPSEEAQPKVIVCHKPGTPAQQNLIVAGPALDAHLGHGDTEGSCPAIAEEVEATESEQEPE